MTTPNFRQPPSETHYLTDTGNKAFIIAEVGVNHNGDVRTAKKLIEKAKSAGADAVKFQGFTAADLDPFGPRRDMLETLELEMEDFMLLAAHARMAGIEFMLTPFDALWCNWGVAHLGLKRIKIASGCIWDRDLIAAAAGSGLPVILSTGMTTHDEMRWALKTLSDNAVTLMYCVSRYPTRPEEINLSKQYCDELVYCGPRTKRPTYTFGFSDHSISVLPPALAVARGARVIEKHITLHRGLEGPDHRASLEVGEFAEMVHLVRQAEIMIGEYETEQSASDEALLAKEERMIWRNR